MEPQRLNKYLSDKGICSRRTADRLIEEGRVFVNGVPARMGQKVTDEDEVKVSGQEVGKQAPRKVIFAVNKPVGVVCTTAEFKGEENVVSLVNYESRLYPVGRLDKESEGLIFLTNDGHFAEEVTNAANYHEKEYEVLVNKDITEHFLKRLEKGVYLQDLNRETAPCTVIKTGEKRFRIILTQGLNRQIRRMCEVCGYEVLRLQRVRIMNVQLGDLPGGASREIRGEELSTLMDSLKKKGKPRAEEMKRKAYARIKEEGRARKEQPRGNRKPAGARKNKT